MGTPRIYVPDLEATEGALVTLDARASHHLRTVLRKTRGAAVRLFSGGDWEQDGVLVEIPRRGPVRVRVGAKHPVSRESPLRTVLFQAVSRGERMDFTIQKAVELGVSRIVPLWSERGARRLPPDRLQRRLDHWRGVAIAACEQCGRTRVPEIAEPREIGQITVSSGARALALLLDPSAPQGVPTASPAPRELWLAAGPEGGFSAAERDHLRAAGFVGVRLGPRTLRTETAALAAMAAVQILWGDLGDVDLQQVTPCPRPAAGEVDEDPLRRVPASR